MKIQLDNLSFAHRGRTVLDQVSTTIDSGLLTCLLGPNASGKSTLLRLLSGELRPTSGRILASGEDLTNLGSDGLALRFATIPQGVQDPSHITVAELVGFGRFRPDRGLWWDLTDPDREVVEKCLRRRDVDKLADRLMIHLSGGEKQRVWLSFCLAQEKPFLLLDESLDALDFRARRSFFQLLKKVIAEDRGVLLATHDLGLATEFADKIIVLDRGRAVYDGSPCQDLPDILKLNGTPNSQEFRVLDPGAGPRWTKNPAPSPPALIYRWSGPGYCPMWSTYWGLRDPGAGVTAWTGYPGPNRPTYRPRGAPPTTCR